MDVKDINNYLSMKEVTRSLGVPAPTLRYWEKEFAEFLNVARTEGNQRRFSPDDIETISRIKNLIDTEKYTTEGARRQLLMEKDQAAALKSRLSPDLIEKEIDNVVSQASDVLKKRLIDLYKK